MEVEEGLRQRARWADPLNTYHGTFGGRDCNWGGSNQHFGWTWNVLDTVDKKLGPCILWLCMLMLLAQGVRIWSAMGGDGTGFIPVEEGHFMIDILDRQ